MYLYLDTSENLTLALFDSSYKLVDLREVESKKTSLILQSCLNDLLRTVNVNLLELDAIIFCAGPGSYTGMRVGQGFVDICKWQGVKVYSFYHFMIPKILGYAEGVWVSSAFKGQDFIHTWNDNKWDNNLFERPMFLEEVKEKKVFSRNDSYEDIPTISTQEMLKSNAKELIKTIVESKLSSELYYYRPIDQEYKVPNA